MDIQRDYHRLRVEQEEVARATARYREDLHTCKNELKGASKVVWGWKESLLALEKEKKYTDLYRDREKVDLERAKVALQEQERALIRKWTC